jgi:hypothetical protein
MKLINKGIYILSLLLLSIPFACTEEEDFGVIAGLDFTVATLNAEGTQTGVLPTTVPGDGRIVYTVDFGDPAEDEKDVFHTSGPMVTYKYPKESATYTITVTASLDGKEDVSITKEHTIVYVDTSLPEPETGIYDDFEGGGNIDSWFGDGVTIDTSFANPFSNTDNDSCGVLKYVDNGTGQYANIRFDVKPNFDLSEDAVFTLKVYVPSSSITGTQTNQIALKLQDGSHAQPWTTQTEIIKPVVLDQWQEITFDFENDTFVNWSTITTDPVDRTDLNRVVLQMNSENNFDSVTAYIDDISYGTKPEAVGAYANDDFEGCDGISSWFGDGVTINKALANPVSGGINTSASVLEYVDDGTGQYANIRFDVKPNFDLSENATFKIKVYVPSSSITGTQTNQIALKLQDGSHAQPWTTQTEIIKPVVLDQWQEITFDFENDTFVNWSTITTDPVDRTDLNRVVIQMNSENNFDSVTAYLDDLVYE